MWLLASNVPPADYPKRRWIGRVQDSSSGKGFAEGFLAQELYASFPPVGKPSVAHLVPVKAGKANVIEALVRGGADITLEDGHGLTFLYCACRVRGHLSCQLENMKFSEKLRKDSTQSIQAADDRMTRNTMPRIQEMSSQGLIRQGVKSTQEGGASGKQRLMYLLHCYRTTERAFYGKCASRFHKMR